MGSNSILSNDDHKIFWAIKLEDFFYNLFETGNLGTSKLKYSMSGHITL